MSRIRDHAIRSAQRLRARVASRHFVSVGRVDPDLIFIAGTGRSGTTWLAELVSRHTRRRLIFEPFLNRRVPLWPVENQRTYISPEDSRPQLMNAARQILTGAFRNDWTDAYNPHIVTRGRVIKDIRANLMLSWLERCVEPFPIFLVVRHPAAVALSWQERGWDPAPAETYLKQQQLVRDHLEPFADVIRSATSHFERAAVLWCIEQLIPLRTLESSSLRIVHYEDLVLRPRDALDPIADVISVDDVLSGDALGRPSSTSDQLRAQAAPESRALGWHYRVSAAELAAVSGVLKSFGLDFLYGEDGLPGGAIRRLRALDEARVRASND